MAKRPRPLLILAIVAMTAGLTVAGVTVSRADPTPSLPPVPADRLLASTLAALSHPFSISGDVQTTLDMGLPQLPTGMSVAGSGPLGTLASFAGTQRFRVWHGTGGLRVAHITDLGEQTVVADRTEAWLWDSSTMTARHVVYADLANATATGGGSSWPGGSEPSGTAGRMGDPTAIAGHALTSLAPYAAVSVDSTTRVAGRPAYQLTLTPTSPLTLIARITIAVDAQTRLPLRLEVFAKGAADPAIASTFTRVSFDAIDPSMFAFTPPPGTTVTTPKLSPHDASTAPAAGTGSRSVTRTFDSGFDTRVAVRLDQPLSADAAALLPYAGPLVSVLTADAGGHTWLLFGFVGLDTLRADAASLS